MTNGLIESDVIGLDIDGDGEDNGTLVKITLQDEAGNEHGFVRYGFDEVIALIGGLTHAAQALKENENKCVVREIQEFALNCHCGVLDEYKKKMSKAVFSLVHLETKKEVARISCEDWKLIDRALGLGIFAEDDTEKFKELRNRLRRDRDAFHANEDKPHVSVFRKKRIKYEHFENTAFSANR